MRTMIFLAFLVGGVGFVVYQLAKFFLSINNGRSKMDAEAITIRKDLDEYPVELIPPTSTEWAKLSSYKYEDKSLLSEYILGHFDTVHSEPIIQYGRKVLMGNNNTVAVVRTALDEITFYDFDHETHVYHNGRPWGYINSTNELIKEGQTIGRAIVDFTNLYGEVSLEDKPSLKMNLPAGTSSITQRAFEDRAPAQYDVDSLVAIAFVLMH